MCKAATVPVCVRKSNAAEREQNRTKLHIASPSWAVAQQLPIKQPAAGSGQDAAADLHVNPTIADPKTVNRTCGE